MTTEFIIAPPLPDEADVLIDEDDGEFFHYYDNHPTEEDLMGESTAQAKLTIYLTQVLEWLYHAEHWFITHNLNIYLHKRRGEIPIVPDVALFKGVVISDYGARELRSWRLYEPERTPPQVVFELASEETWEADLDEKPAKYALLRAREYIAYDPNQPPYWPQEMGRLRGWRLVDGVMVEQTCDARGWLWSAELESWLVPDGALLRLYDRAGQLRLTGEQAERQRAQQEQRAREQEQRAREQERQRAEQERQRADTAEQRLAEVQADLDRLRSERGGTATSR